MTRSWLYVAPLLLAASPALATGGFDCRTSDGSRVGLSGTVGRVPGAPLVGAALHLGERILATTDAEPRVVIARSWLDAERIWVDLADPQLTRFEAQLRVRVGQRGTASGTLVRDGVTRRVDCTLE